MTFTQWYEKTYNEKWMGIDAAGYNFAMEKAEEYETYCTKDGIDSYFDG